MRPPAPARLGLLEPSRVDTWERAPPSPRAVHFICNKTEVGPEGTGRTGWARLPPARHFLSGTGLRASSKTDEETEAQRG